MAPGYFFFDAYILFFDACWIFFFDAFIFFFDTCLSSRSLPAPLMFESRGSCQKNGQYNYILYQFYIALVHLELWHTYHLNIRD